MTTQPVPAQTEIEAIAGHLTTAAALLEPITDHIKYGLDLDSIYE